MVEYLVQISHGYTSTFKNCLRATPMKQKMSPVTSSQKVTSTKYKIPVVYLVASAAATAAATPATALAGV